MQQRTSPTWLWTVSVAAVALTWPAAAGWSAGAGDPNPAPNDIFGPLPRTSIDQVPGASLPGPPSTPVQSTRPAAWPSSAPGHNDDSLPAARPSPPGGTSISRTPYTATQDPVLAQGPLPNAAPPAAGYPIQPFQPMPPPQGAPGVQTLPYRGAAQANLVPNDRGGAQAPPVRDEGLKPCEGAEILARVGTEVILAGELLGAVNEMLERNREQIPPDQWDLVRTKLMQQQLRQHIETKLVYLDAKREFPAEAFPNIEKRLAEFFEKNELEKMLKRAGVNSREELDAKFRTLGTSLEHEKHSFMERTLAQEWIRQKVKYDGEITPDEIVAYYRDHVAEFEEPSKVRWEEVLARFSKYGDKAPAYDAIVGMGNEILAGRPLAEVAKARSDGLTARDGGARDWTTQGSLVAEELDRALFGLPPGQLSQIIETKQGYHIVRVVERKEKSRTSLVEAQVTIRDKIRDQKSKQQMETFLANLATRIPVSTIYDQAQGPGPAVRGQSRE